jgi:hypothetical protein
MSYDGRLKRFSDFRNRNSHNKCNMAQEPWESDDDAHMDTVRGFEDSEEDSDDDFKHQSPTLSLSAQAKLAASTSTGEVARLKTTTERDSAE